jgi:hypothetical protein
MLMGAHRLGGTGYVRTNNAALVPLSQARQATPLRRDSEARDQNHNFHEPTNADEVPHRTSITAANCAVIDCWRRARSASET